MAREIPRSGRCPAGTILRIIDGKNFAALGENLVSHVRSGLHQFQVARPLQPLLNDFAVEHPEEAATETEAQSLAALGQVTETGVIQTQLAQ